MPLPGVTTVLKDRFYTLSRTDVPTGPRVLAIATRDTADLTLDARGTPVPDYDPYAPRSEADCISAFGDGSGCHRAYLEMVAGGAVAPLIVAVPDNTTDAMLSGASAGPGGEDVIDAAFEAAETVRPDIIVCWGRGGHPNDWESPATPGNDLPIGFHADNVAGTANNMAVRVAQKCADITDRSHPVFAIMGVAPYTAGTAESMTAAQIGTHLGLAGLVDHEAAFGYNGHFLSVVATEVNVAGYPQNSTDRSRAGVFGYANGAATYAGFISQLNSWVAPTGKAIFNVTGLRYNPTRPQQQAIIDKGLVPVTLDFNRVPIWVDGQTFAKQTSDYIRLTTLRIAFAATQGVRQIAQGFIGEAATLHNRNAFETAIHGFLRGMQQTGAILDADSVVTYIPRENKAIVDLVLRPVFELRNIEIQISVDLG